MGAMEELGLKPGVITGDDVLHVALLFQPDSKSAAFRVRPQAPIRYPCHRTSHFCFSET